MDINTLMSLCTETMSAAGYNASTIKSHQTRWENGLRKYMQAVGAQDYTIEIGNRYLDVVCSNLSKSTLRGRRRSIQILNEYLEYGKISNRIHDFQKYPLPENELGKLANSFYDYYREKRNAPLTIVHHQRALSLLLKFLEIKGINAPNNISADILFDFVNSGPQTNQKISSIRAFFNYLQNQGVIEVRSILSILLKVKCKEFEPLPSVYSAEEIATIENAINRESPIGKRDFAVVILASRLGLRASDIASMKPSNIDVTRQRISIIQHKTKEPLVLPLLPIVKRAISDYLEYARPKVDFDNIFVTQTSPLRPLTTESINSIVRRAISASGIKVGKRHFGTHSLRHSLATRLLSNGNSLPTISGILGHKNTETTMAYLRIDTEGLRAFALDAPLVSNDFFNQKSRIFYGESDI